MRIFLTGASGFVGSYLLKKLVLSVDYEVAVLLRDPKNAWRIKSLLPRVKIVTGDLNDLGAIESQLSNFFPEMIVHLAWNGVFGADRNHPSQWRNVNSTLELIEIANRLGVESFVGLGSQAEYGPCENKIKESFPTNPTTLYGASKLSAQLLGQRLCEVHGIRFVWLRLFSAFGPMDNSDWLIPYVIKSLAAKEKPKLTEAEQLWDYIYVKDVAAAIIAVMGTKNTMGIYNLGSGNAYKLKSVIEEIRDLIDISLPLGFGEVDYRSDQVMHLQADISKICRETGWAPKVNISNAIEETVNWYLKRPL